MLKVAIVGCGKIADSHAAQIRRIPGCEMVGACDREELMAKQLCERFPIAGSYSDIKDMIERARPDVIHITTPPQSHFKIARDCLQKGCHVYVEKPFTLYAEEAQELIDIANRNGLRLTAGHDDQFRHVARRMRKVVQAGYLGGAPLHMESYYCYELNESSSYAKALLSDKKHWVRDLPGKLLQNIISHGIARIAEYLQSDNPEVMVCGFISPAIRRAGESEIVDELRVIVREEQGTTAYFTFSSQIRPSLHLFRVYGPKNGIMLDLDNETLIKLRGQRYKSYLEQFVPPINFALQYAGNFRQNVSSFLANDFHPKAGMKFLIESFYRSVVENAPLPIPYREIVLTSQIMDKIFRGLDSNAIDPADGGQIFDSTHTLTAQPTSR